MKLSRIFLLCLFAVSMYGQATAPQPTYNQATTPTSCRFGDTWFKPGVTAGQNIYGCTTAGTPGVWTLEGGTGSGGGDASTNTSTSVDGEMTVFNGTTGKSLKRSSLTGVPAFTSGVPAAITGTGSNCVHVDGTSATCPTGSGFSNPMTTAGDLIVGGSSGTATRLAKGSDGQVLTLVSGAEAWAAASGGGGTVGFAVTRTSATVLTIAPGNVSCGGIAYSFATSLTLTITGTMSIANLAYDCAVSPAVIRVYADTTNATLAGTGAGSVVGSTTIPATSFKFYQWTAASSNWDTSGGADYRAQLAGMTFTGDGNLIFTPNPTTGNIAGSLNTAVVPLYFTGLGTLTFGSIAANTCGEQPITVSGALPTNVVIIGPPLTFTANLSISGYVSATDTVKVRICNPTTGAITPTAATSYRATVLQ